MQKKKKVYMNCLNVTKGVLLINETGVKAWACNDMIKIFLKTQQVHYLHSKYYNDVES